MNISKHVWGIVALGAACAAWGFLSWPTTRTGVRAGEDQAQNPGMGTAPNNTLATGVPAERAAHNGSSTQTVEQSISAQAFLGNADDLDRFWQDCGPMDPEKLEPILAQLRERVATLEQGRLKLQQQSAAPVDWDKVSTPEEYFQVYSVVGLTEAKFLMDECIAGRMRKAHSARLPTGVLNASSPDVQLVPHLADHTDGIYIVRLDRKTNPDLFAQRRQLFDIAQRMADARSAQPGAGVSPASAHRGDRH